MLCLNLVHVRWYTLVLQYGWFVESKLHNAKGMPIVDKQDACQLAKEKAEKDKEDLQELTKAMIEFLKAMRNGELDHD